MNAAAHTAKSEAHDSAASIYAERLMGVWTLVTYADEHPDRDDTQPFGPNPQGFLIYTADGFVSAQLMKPGRPAFHSSDWLHLIDGRQCRIRLESDRLVLRAPGAPVAGGLSVTRRLEWKRIVANLAPST
jgi:hypothetical protein